MVARREASPHAGDTGRKTCRPDRLGGGRGRIQPGHRAQAIEVEAQGMPGLLRHKAQAVKKKNDQFNYVKMKKLSIKNVTFLKASR